jgi:hypothetical protein
MEGSSSSSSGGGSSGIRAYESAFTGEKNSSYGYQMFRSKMMRHLMKYQHSWRDRMIKLIEFKKDEGEDPNKSLNEYLKETEEVDGKAVTTKVKYYKNAIGTFCMIPEHEGNYRDALMTRFKTEAQGYDKLSDAFIDNIESPALELIEGHYTLWDVVRVLDWAFNTQTNMSIFNHIVHLMRGPRFNPAKETFPVWVNGIVKYGKEKLNNDIKYNQYLSVCLINRLPNAGHGVEQWTQF